MDDRPHEPLSQTVDVLVGPNKQQFKIHMRYIQHEPQLCNLVCSQDNSFQSIDGNGKLHLPYVQPRAFSELLFRVYGKNCESQVLDPADHDQTESWSKLEPSIQLILLEDRLNVDDLLLEDLITIHGILIFAGAADLQHLPFHAAACVYQNTSSGCRLRRIFLQFRLHQTYGAGHVDYFSLPKAHPDLLADAVLWLLRGTDRRLMTVDSQVQLFRCEPEHCDQHCSGSWKKWPVEHIQA